MEPDDDKTQTHIVLAKGTMVGYYRIIEKIGAGGMGEVYLAEDTQLDRKVALKFLPPHLCQDEDCRKRFKREAQAAAKLDHFNIVTIHEVGKFQGRPYFAMQLVEGKSLRDLIRDKGLSFAEIIDLAMQVCEGLSEAHRVGIVHRDIKPSNILIDTKGHPRLVDFGLASVRGTEHLTQTGSTLGTVGYMSPEQVKGETADARSDLFSLGVVLYEMIAGQTPFGRDSDAATLHSIAHDSPQPLARYRSGVSDALQAVVDKALEKDKETRYQTAEGVISDLKKLRKELQTHVSVTKSRPSIAVLPFVNLSADPEQEYFCDGMAEELINALSHIENLRVIARTSAFSFKGKNEDVREIGRKLGVGTLLEGSVRKAGNHLRITAQLVEVADGSHLWSERYDRKMEDVFAIQDEISLAIVDKLKIKLLRDEKATLVKCCTDNVEAYNLYLKGRYYWNKRTPEELKKAIELFEQVIELDPEFALAYTGMADCHSVLGEALGLPPIETFPKAKAMALKALEIDESLAEAHTSLAYVRWAYDRDWSDAEREFKRATRLNPRYAIGHQWYAEYLTAMGRTAQAIEEIRTAQELDPLCLIVNVASAWILIVAGNLVKAEEQCRQVLEMDPNFFPARIPLEWIYEQQGMHDEAIVEHLEGEVPFALFGSEEVEALRKTYSESGWQAYWQKHVALLKQQLSQRYIPASAIATDYVRLGDMDLAFEWLETAYQERDPGLIYLRVDPTFGSLRSDPRFTALLKKIGLE